LILTARKINTILRPIATIVRVKFVADYLDRRLNKWVTRQRFRNVLRHPKPVAGVRIGENLITMPGGRVLDTVTNTILPAGPVLRALKDQEDNPLVKNAESFEREIEIVTGIDGKRIEFNLKSSEGPLELNDGFMIEVFLSGSDGKLTKLVKNDVINPLEDDVIVQGYNSFLSLGTDK